MADQNYVISYWMNSIHAPRISTVIFVHVFFVKHSLFCFTSSAGKVCSYMYQKELQYRLSIYHLIKIVDGQF